MTYEILIDNETLYYHGDSECVVTDPHIKLSMNDAGTATMGVPTINPLYNRIYSRKSMITVKKNNKDVFYGEVRGYERGFDMKRELKAVGVLSFLKDSIQPQHDYGTTTIASFLSSVLNVHNQQMFDNSRKKIYRGTVTVNDTVHPNQKITDHETTLDAIKENLIDHYGGVLRIRKQSGNFYLDYVELSSYGDYCEQGINFGENLLDYTENFDAEDVKTVVIPYGARLEREEHPDDGFEHRVDITSVNNGLEYLVNNAAVQNFGHVWDTVIYDDITSPSQLKSAGQTYLSQVQYEKAVFKLNAADLSAIDANMDSIYFGDRIHVYAEPFGLNSTYPIVEMDMYPLEPEKEKVVLSANIRTKKPTLTGQMQSSGRSMKNMVRQEVMKIENVIQGEMQSLLDSFSGQYGGYKLSEFDEDGLWLRDLYMDAPDKDDATNIIEISMRGIRFSNGGYAAPTSNAWKTALGIDGKIGTQEIFANVVIAGLLKAGIIEDVAGKTSWNLETGKLISKTNEYSEQLQIYDGIISGIYNNQTMGYIDLNAYYPGSRKAVVGSNGELVVEFGNRVSFVNMSSGYEIGYIDGSGLHMNVAT